eukprot:gene23844-30119_t
MENVVYQIADPVTAEKGICCLEGRKEEKFTGKSFRYLGAHCRELTGFNVSYQSSKIENADLIAIIENNHKLRKVDESFIGETFRMFSGGGKQTVMGRLLTEKLINALATHCPELEHVILKSLSKYTFSSMMNLFRGCPNIKKIKVDALDSFRFSCEDNGDEDGEGEGEEHGDRPAVLKVLEMGVFENEQREMNKNLVELFGLQKDFDHLMFFQRCLSDEVLTLLTETSPQLKHLLLEKCDGCTVTPAGLREITNAEYRSLFDIPNGLTALILQALPNLTTEGVIHILTVNPRLERFDFSKCPGVDAEAVEKHLRQGM